MIRLVLLVFVSTGLAMAQGTPPEAPTPNPATRSANAQTGLAEPAVPPNAAVITIKGICSSSTTKTEPAKSTAGSAGSECKTVITRAEFERLVDLLQVPPAARKQFATQYATALIMLNEAHKRGLDHGPRYDELVRIARMQALSRELARDLQEQSAKISDQEVEKYYHDHSGAYEEATLERLYVPRQQQNEPPKANESEADRKKREDDSEAAMKKEADELHDRAVKGEDFGKLEAEAYKTANYKATPPPVKMDKVRPGNLPPAQSGAVIAMKPGEVSQLFSDPGGYFVYKLIEKQIIPFDTVRDEIRSSLEKQKMQETENEIRESATPSFSDSYFGSMSPEPRNQGFRPSLNSPPSSPNTGPK